MLLNIDFGKASKYNKKTRWKGVHLVYKKTYKRDTQMELG